MAYLALYRKFRPQGFDGLIGQDQVVKILKNQIKTGKIGHAYLFCGARGTGKTTVAKIFARAINCLSPIDGSPCGECEVCRGLKDPSNMDILEMDAASNNGVDDVRDMREKIQYPPVVGKYKIYIVDEVHMLSPAAFNALLKTLEEPPSHAVFIFATTEVHKIPQTILSRCMRFDFKLIPQAELSKLISGVFDSIGKGYELAAVDEIARAGEGSARDSLSIADMCSSYSTGKLTYADVLEVLGATDKGRILQLAEYIIKGDTGKALTEIDELAMLGKNMKVLADDIAGALRDLIICNTAKNANAILGMPQEAFEKYAAVAAECDGHRLLRLVDIFTSLDNAFRYTSHPRIVLEIAVVRACNPQSDYDIDALAGRVSELEKGLKEGAAFSAQNKYPAENAQKRAVLSEEPAKEPTEKPVKKEPYSPAATDFNAPDSVNAPATFNASVSAKNVEQTKVVEEVPPIDDIGVLPETDLFSMSQAEYIPFGEEAFIADEIPAPVPKPAPVAAPKEQEREVVPPSKVWGNVLKTLRSNGNAVLWTVCRDVTARAENGVLTIYVSNDSEYDMFMREDHFKTLTDAANLFGEYTVKISKRASVDDGKEEFEKDVQTVKQMFGEDIVKIIKND